MGRFCIHMAYNGGPFHGWQIQPDAPTVQEKLEECLAKIYQTEVGVTGCGRTDTGVHASDFYAHFDLDREIEGAKLAYKLNCMLPKEIAIFDVYPVDSEWHARFTATSRMYHYFISPEKSAFDYDFSWYLHTPLDMDKMNEACKALLGTQDFTSFSKLHTQTHTNICTITKALWEKVDDKLRFTVTADRFLHNMVRAIVGTCVEVGRGKMTVEEFKDVIASQSRQKAGASVPAQGLFLAKVGYPK